MTEQHDPLDGLRGFDAGARPPEPALVRARARRIRTRRRSVLASATAVSVVLVGVLVLMVRPGGEIPSDRSLSLDSPESARSRRLGDGDLATGTESVSSGTSAAVGAEPATMPTTADSSTKTRAGQRASEAPGPAAARMTAASWEVRLEASKEPVLPGRPATVTLVVCSHAGTPQSQTFSSSQRYDFEVSRDGKVVWRWAEGRMFSQVMDDETWQPAECKRFSETWSATGAAPGRYQAVGILASVGRPRTQQQDVCVTACPSS